MSRKAEYLDWKDQVDVGVILEQNWMVRQLPQHIPRGRMFYCYSIDRDLYTINDGGKKLAFVQSNGSSSTACYVEEFRLRKAKRVYRIGTTGALQDDINIGDAILSFAAIRDEGTSAQYVPANFPAFSDPHLVAPLYKSLLKEGVPTHLGLTWTTDGRFVESDKKMLEFSKLGVKNVDMETSALMVVCAVRGMSGTSVGIVTDKPINDLEKEVKGRVQDLAGVRGISEERFGEILNALLDAERKKRQ